MTLAGQELTDGPVRMVWMVKMVKMEHQDLKVIKVNLDPLVSLSPDRQDPLDSPERMALQVNYCFTIKNFTVSKKNKKKIVFPTKVMRNLRKLFATSDYFCFAIIIPNLELVSENTFNSYRNKKFEITTFQWHLTKKKRKRKKE